MCGCTCDTAHTWRSEDSFRESVVSFHYVGPRDWTQVFGLGDKHLFLLSRLASPESRDLPPPLPFISGDGPRLGNSLTMGWTTSPVLQRLQLCNLTPCSCEDGCFQPSVLHAQAHMHLHIRTKLYQASFPMMTLIVPSWRWLWPHLRSGLSNDCAVNSLSLIQHHHLLGMWPLSNNRLPISITGKVSLLMATGWWSRGAKWLGILTLEPEGLGLRFWPAIF